VTTQDLNIPDPPEGADPQSAAGFNLGAASGSFAQNGYILALNSGSSLAPVGLMPLSASGATVIPISSSLMTQGNLLQQPVLSTWQSAFPSRSRQASSLVVQGKGMESEHELNLWLATVSTDLTPTLGNDRENELTQSRIRLRGSLVTDSFLDELASGPQMRVRAVGARDVPGTTSASAVARDGGAVPELPIVLTPQQVQPGRPSAFAGRLAVILLAVGSVGHGASRPNPRHQQAGRFHSGRRLLKSAGRII
jgi:hypothetical protein